MRKRLKEDTDDAPITSDEGDKRGSVDMRLADELCLELQCGCCSELVYNPVLVLPCQHFFCGSCCVLWVKNGGTNCPACRGISTVVTPFRALQTVVDTLLRIAPDRARTERERQQADEVYKPGLSLRIPPPKEPSPEPSLNINAELAQPCPHCPADNPHGWNCPQPIPDPAGDADRAWHLEDGLPPGHGQCAHCENMLALEAPPTTKCDLCRVPFCGINIPGRCQAVPLSLQLPHGLTNISDLIESAEVYECFDGNNYEVDILFDYLRSRNKTPRNIYREILAHVQTSPRGLLPLLESEVFSENNGGLESVPQGPYNRICRMCSAEVLLWGLRDWWTRERQTGQLDAAVLGRPDCPDGNRCLRQKETEHTRQFNHIIASVPMSSSIAIEEPFRGPNPMTASSPSIEAIERMINPQSRSSPAIPQHRSAALSFLLNATDFDEAAAFATIARRPRSPSPDLRDAIDALSS